jgi:hypothetical protein
MTKQLISPVCSPPLPRAERQFDPQRMCARHRPSSIIRRSHDSRRSDREANVLADGNRSGIPRGGPEVGRSVSPPFTPLGTSPIERRTGRPKGTLERTSALRFVPCGRRLGVAVYRNRCDLRSVDLRSVRIRTRYPSLPETGEFESPVGTLGTRVTEGEAAIDPDAVGRSGAHEEFERRFELRSGRRIDRRITGRAPIPVSWSHSRTSVRFVYVRRARSSCLGIETVYAGSRVAVAVRSTPLQCGQRSRTRAASTGRVRLEA